MNTQSMRECPQAGPGESKTMLPQRRPQESQAIGQGPQEREIVFQRQAGHRLKLVPNRSNGLHRHATRTGRTKEAAALLSAVQPRVEMCFRLFAFLPLDTVRPTWVREEMWKVRFVDR